MASLTGDAQVRHPADYTLHIFLGERPAIAELEQQPGEGSFDLRYADAWVASAHAFALSPALGLAGRPAAGAIRRFLENLLPEGDALDDLARVEAISRSNVFALVRHLGRETTGALTFLPAGQTPTMLAPLAREISTDELQQRIAQRATLPFSVWDGRVRLSVAGQQDKLLVQRVDERLFLVDGGLSSTHILKPQPSRDHLPHMVANEHYCMQLADRIGQQAYRRPMCAAVDILRVPDPVLCVRRFDRMEVGEQRVPGVAGGVLPRVRRQHIIDACQALDLPVAMKYERNFGNGRDVAHIRDGASFERLYALRPLLEHPAQGLRHITFWSVMTLLLGNSDAHGKNLSFSVGPGGLSVAPLYDLVSVLPYDARRIDHSFAMAFGDAFHFEEIAPVPLADHCQRCGIDRRFFARELRLLCRLAERDALALASSHCYTDEERETVQRIAQGVVARARQLDAMASAIPRLPDDLF